MVDPSPWSPDVAQLPIVSAFQVVYDVALVVEGRTSTVALRPTAVRLGYDRRRTPYAVADVDVAMPNQGTLDLLDSDTFDLRLAITVGYRKLTTGVAETYEVARLRLRSSSVDYLAQKVTLHAESDECIVTQQAATAVLGPYTTATTYVSAIQAIVASAFPGDTMTWDVSHDPESTLTKSWSVAVGDDLWDAVTELADSAGVEVRNDGTGTWVIAKAPSAPGLADAVLNVGSKGAVTALRVATGKAQGLTDVIGVWTYQTSGTGVTSLEYALASTGRTPRSVAVIKRTRKPVNAGRTVLSMMNRGLRRGRTVDLEAVPLFWVRPSDTITAVIPGGTQLRFLVEAVEYDPVTAKMRVAGQFPLPNVAANVTVTATGSVSTP